MSDLEITRRPSPIGVLRWPPRFIICRAANRPALVGLNRYPGQVIGFALRMPKTDTLPGHPYLSIVWARPSRWWADR